MRSRYLPGEWRHFDQPNTAPLCVRPSALHFVIGLNKHLSGLAPSACYCRNPAVGWVTAYRMHQSAECVRRKTSPSEMTTEELVSSPRKLTASSSNFGAALKMKTSADLFIT